MGINRRTTEHDKLGLLAEFKTCSETAFKEFQAAVPLSEVPIPLLYSPVPISQPQLSPFVLATPIFEVHILAFGPQTSGFVDRERLCGSEDFAD